MTAKRTAKALRDVATSARAKAELDLLLERPGLSGADLRNLGAVFTRVSGAGEVTPQERDLLLGAIAKLPRGKGD